MFPNHRTTDEGFFKSKRLEKVFWKFCFRFWNYFLHYIIQIIFIVFNIYIYISQRLDIKGCMVPSILQFQYKTNIKEGQDMHKNIVYFKSL